MQFIKKIQNFAFQNNLWSNGARIIVGVSGGPDSTCLLSVLAKLAPKYNFKIHIAHVNYGLREKESEKDEIFVKELAKTYNVELTILKLNKTKYDGNLENELRKIRYDFFEKLRKKLKFDFIAVAHNQDDQAETVLMRIMRGTGLAGLGAIKAKRGCVIRPLLRSSKLEILAYLKQEKLKFRIDKSNIDTRFTRNRIRHELLPFLEASFNPAIKKTLGAWALVVADDYDFIEKSARNFVALSHKKKSTYFEATDFLKLHAAIQRQVICDIFQKIKNNDSSIESRQIEEILKVIKSNKENPKKTLVGGLNIIKKGDKIEIS